MENETRRTQVTPRIPARVWRVLNEKLATCVDSAAAMVEPGQFVSGYCTDDPMSRHNLVVTIEKAFDITLDASAFDQVQTVEDLATLVSVQLEAKKSKQKGRGYIVVYRDENGGVVETHVHALNHREAVEQLHEEGLVEVLAVSREEDEDDDGHRRSRWGVGLTLFILALLTAGAVFGYYCLLHR